MTQERYLKRYLLFIGTDHTMSSGWDAFVRDFDDIKKAIDYFNKQNILPDEWCQIVDCFTSEVVKQYFFGSWADEGWRND